MAGSFVQKLGTDLDLTGSSGTRAINLSVKPTAGNQVILDCTLYNSTARTWTGATATDNCTPANTYTLRAVTAQVPGSNGIAGCAFVCDNVQNIPGGTMTITITLPGFCLSASEVYEFSGLDTAGAFDSEAVGSASATTSSTTPSVTAVAASTMLLARVALDAADANANINLPAGWTDVEAHQDGTTSFSGRLTYKNVSGTGTQAGATYTHDSANTALYTLALKQATSGVSGTVAYTNINDTLSASGTVVSFTPLMGQACL